MKCNPRVQRAGSTGGIVSVFPVFPAGAQDGPGSLRPGPRRGFVIRLSTGRPRGAGEGWDGVPILCEGAPFLLGSDLPKEEGASPSRPCGAQGVARPARKARRAAAAMAAHRDTRSKCTFSGPRRSTESRPGPSMLCGKRLQVVLTQRGARDPC